jgi:outer membrane protein assembly factor BamB
MGKRSRTIWARQVLGIGCLCSSVALGIVAGQQPAPQKEAPPQKAAPQKAPPVQVKVVGGGGIVIQGNAPIVLGQIPIQPDAGKEGNSQKVKLPVDPRARRKIEEAKRFIETQDWQSAVKILQSLLDATEDNFLQESETDKGRRVSVRAEANRMLGSLPTEGKRFYEQQFGSVARLAFKQAKASANPQSMADVALKYVHTQAGAEAAAWLGAYHLDHGRYIVAALCFERLLSREQTEINVATLYKAAIAFERAGDAGNRDRAWKLLQSRMNQPADRLPAAVRSWDETKLKRSLASVGGARSQQGQTDWRLFMGGVDRAARSSSTAPFMEPMFPAMSITEPGTARQELQQSAKRMISWGAPVIPGAHALVVRNHAIFRTVEGITAVNLKTGAKAWESASDVSLAASMRPQNTVDPETLSYLQSYRDIAPAIVLENTQLGTLSADNELVYAVEDLALPPNFKNDQMMWRRGGAQPTNRYNDYHLCNHLIAYDIDGGRAVWSIGTKVPDQTFSQMYFLGPPLPLGDKLYVLAEMKAEIRLLCLQNNKIMKVGQNEEFEYSVELVWSQPLGVVDRSITEEPIRRTKAALLSYSDGILVCPTNAGAVVGVDLLTRTLVWAFNYQNESVNTDSNDADRPGQINRRIIARMPRDIEAPSRGACWNYSAPVISQGKVLLAPPDGSSLQAINLRDGTLAWSVSRVDSDPDPLPPDFYLAGVHDQAVILVGRQNVHALDIKTGKKLWNANTGIPAGRGVANESTYFLPNKNNEIVSINLTTGEVIARSKARQKEGLGNLTLVGENLLSLSHHHLLVYPIQLNKERQIAERLKVNALDPVALLDRGELAWQRGDLAAAVTDFRLALKQKPASDLQAKGESKLADSILTLLEKDFVKHEGDIPELEKLTLGSTVPEGKDEQAALLDRKARYHRVLAQGREAQGRIDETLTHYEAFARLDDKLITSPDDPLVRVTPKVWALGQSISMVKRLKPELLAKLDGIVQKKWDAVKDGSYEAIRDFTDFYGELGTPGQLGLLQFVEIQMSKREMTQATLRLMPLLQSSNPIIAARAHDAMARLNIRLGELENAAYYYRLLARKYPSVIVRDGKNGSQLYQQLTTDKRFLPYLDDRPGLSNLQNFTIEKVEQNFRGNQGMSRGGGSGAYTVLFTPKQELPPHLRRYSLEVSTDAQSPSRSSYLLRDLLERDEKKQIIMPSKSFSMGMMSFYGAYYQERVTPHFQMCGDVMVFAWSNMIVGIDPLKRKELWSFNVMGDLQVDREGQTFPVDEMPGRFKFMQGNATFELLGTFGPPSAQRLIMCIRYEGLVCINPQTGEKLWSRYGINPGMDIFGDEEYAILMPPLVGRAVEDKPLAIRLLDGTVTELDIVRYQQFRAASIQTVGRHMLLHRSKEKYSEASAELAEANLMKLVPGDRAFYHEHLKPAGEEDELELVDSLTGATVWKQTIGRGTTMMASAQPSDLVGYLETSGKVNLLNVETGKPWMQTQLRTVKEGYKSASFLIEDKNCYVFCCKDLEQTSDSGRVALMPQYQWLRSVAVNGPAACINTETRQVLWEETLPMQYVVTHRFNELPFLMCSSVTRRMSEKEKPQRRVIAAPALRGFGRTDPMQTNFQCFSKQTGKSTSTGEKLDSEVYYGGPRNSQGYQELTIDTHTGKVELRSPSQSLTFQIVTNALAASK